MSVNKACLLGNVGQDPKLSATAEGKEIASFSIATTDYWKDKQTQEKKSKTEWHNIVIFSQGLVNIVKNYVKKGSKLYIEGKLQTRKWTDKQGVDRYSTEIVLQGFNSKLELLDSKQDDSQQKNDQAFEKVHKAVEAVDNSIETYDETPF
jgi:single-strand DNA-binding protein